MDTVCSSEVAKKKKAISKGKQEALKNGGFIPMDLLTL